MTDVDLVRAAHANIVGSFGSLTEHLDGGETHDVDGVTVVVTRSPIPLFNEVLPVGDGVTSESLVRGVEIVRDRGVDFLVQLREGVDDHLADAATGAGLREDPNESLPLMVLDVLSRKLDAGPDLQISVCDDTVGLDRHLHASSSALGIDAALIETFMGPTIVSDPNYALFVGLLKGVPVATSIAYFTPGVVGIYNVNTTPDVRRRGYRWAMTSAALASGAARGCEIGVLQSSAMATHLYQSHGFRTISTYRAFVEMSAE